MELTRIVPTDEQTEALRLFATGQSMVLDALAGTGKTSTLRLLAWGTRRRGRYIAYNKAIVTDVQGALPERCAASTAHSLAFRAVGTKYAHRLRQPRIKSWEVAHRLDIVPLYVSAGLPKEKRLAPGWLASHVMRAVANFTNSQDREPGVHHFPYADGIDLPDTDGRRTHTNNRHVAAELEGALRKAWQDLSNEAGVLRFRHDDYLKLWALGDPIIESDYILLDEAQDTNPVLAGVIEAQDHAQRVLVGDENQQLYEWRGAVDAMAGFPDENRRSLTQTFRFGPAIAWEANAILEELEAPLRIVPSTTVDSRVGRFPDSAHDSAAVLCRTNARALQTVIDAQIRHQPVHLVGGGTEVASFARAVRELQSEGRTSHHDLACFESWQEVLDYCVAPGTRLLTDDLRWLPIERLCVGDGLLAFDEHSAAGSGGRRFRRAAVEQSRRIVRPCYRVWTADGREILSSIEHRWLVKSGMALRWKQTSMLRPGDRIATTGTPWEFDDSHEGGWLAGMFDGEGWADRHGLALAQREGPTLDRVRRGLKERGFAFTEDDRDNLVHLRITGGAAERLRLLGTLRPERLIANAMGPWEGMRVETRSGWATVRGVEDIGEAEVVALATSTRTFIAEGLLSHNCRETHDGEMSLLVRLIEEFGTEAILRAVDGTTPEGPGVLTVSTAHKAKGRQWDHVRIAEDFVGRDPNTPELRLRYVAFTRARRVLDQSVFRDDPTAVLHAEPTSV